VSGYLVGIFLVATATGLAWWFSSHDAVRTWSVVTAVLVVSCPCAIGLAFPLADELATVALRRGGVFVREADLWPRLGRIRKIIFDKTGTLTLETPVLRNPAALVALTPPARAALFALVRDNPHPVSQSLYENLLSAGLPDAGADGIINEDPGFGVSLQGAAGRWSLGRPGWRGGTVPAIVTEDHDTEFAHDGMVLARFRFADTARVGARAEIDALRSLGFEVFILSGDRRAKVAEMAGALGLPPQNALGECTAQEKADWLRQHEHAAVRRSSTAACSNPRRTSITSAAGSAGCANFSPSMPRVAAPRPGCWVSPWPIMRWPSASRWPAT
jgi:Cu2+-exporting ATPase